VLDVGCGSGVFLSRAVELDARAFGLDAAEGLIELARRRVPGADLRVGDLQSLPYEDDRFDLVTGFNSFFFAADMTAGLRDAGRVAKPGAPVLIQVWGRPERCDLTPLLQALRPLRPPPRPGAPTPASLWQPGVVEAVAAQAGLAPQTSFVARTAVEYEDEHEALRCLLASGAAVEALERSGHEAVRSAAAQALAPFRTRGGYRLENEWRYVIAAASGAQAARSSTSSATPDPV
jgi:SAM-dependent methyltransferase